MKIEEWKPVVGYEGLYEVSNFGRVRSVDRYLPNARKNGLRIQKGRMIKLNVGKFGYYRAALSKNGKIKLFCVHRLVAFAFPEICGEYFEGAQINHKDEDKSNNSGWNLEWVTAKTNINYGTHNARQSKTRQENPWLSKPVKMFSLEGVYQDTFHTVAAAIRFLGKGCVTHISRCASGKKWHNTAYDHRWEWA